MKQIILIMLIGINFLYANIGKITSTVGEVIVIRDNKEIKATSGMLLELEDKIRTEDNSKALIHLNDETTINVGKKSDLLLKEFVIDEVNPEKSKLNMNFGNGLFRTITGKIGKLNPNRFKIKTKTGSIGIRGTIFDVVVTSDVTKVGVIEGGVYYVDERTANQFEVKVGQKLIYDDQDQKIDIIDGDVEETEEIEIDNGNTESQEGEQSESEESQEGGQSESESEESQEGEQSESEESQEGEQSESEESQGGGQSESQENEGAQEGGESEEASIEDDTDNVLGTDGGSTDDGSTDGDPVLTNTPTNTPVPEIEPEDTKINTNPIITTDGNTTLKNNETLAIKYTVTDAEDGNGITPTLTSSTSNASISIQNGTIIYNPSDDFVGQDRFTITATDSKGAKTSQTIIITVEDYLPETPTTPTLDDLDDASKIIVGNDTYMEFGFEKDSTNKIIDVYSSGTVTPSVVIEGYINSSISASYSGTIAAIITDSANNTSTSTSGSIDLDFDFGNENFTGNININENWNADINSGSITSSSFSSTDISSNVESGIQDITGDINGNFLGPNADNVAGKINLSSSSDGSVKASFGGSKDGRNE